MNSLFFFWLVKLFAGATLDMNVSASQYYSQMDGIVFKLREDTGLDIEYKFEDFRFEAGIVNVILRMKGLYDCNEKYCDYTQLIITSASEETFKEVIDKLLINIGELDITKIKNNLSKYNKSDKVNVGYTSHII